MQFPLRFLFACTIGLFLIQGADAQYTVQDDMIKEQERRNNPFGTDSTETAPAPEGIYAWTIEPRFGDIRPAEYDTVPHLFQNEIFTDGPTGHYNYTGLVGSPRISRHFNEQSPSMMQNPFIFLQPYDYFVKGPGDLRFTNTLSPFTNITYHQTGNKTNGEDHFRALFSVNAGKKLGLGFKTDYVYGKGYYDAQSTALLDGTLFASYLSDHYEMHVYYSFKQLKNRENGGIDNDDYVMKPESFSTSYGTSDMPTNLTKAWNKINGNTIYLTHRYNLGFRRYKDAEGNEIRRDALPKLFGLLGDSLQTDSLQLPVPADQAAPSLPPENEEAPAPNGLPTDGMTVKHDFPPLDDAEKGMRPPGENPPTGNPPSQEPPKAEEPAKGKSPRMPRIPEGAELSEASMRMRMEEQMDSLEITSEFIPVSSFIHTLQVSQFKRRFLSNIVNDEDDPGYFAYFYLPTDSARDKTEHIRVENTLALELHEGFSKWMKAGIRLFGKHEFNRFTLPDENNVAQKTIENYVTLGAQILSQQNDILRYNILGEMRTSGTDWGEFNVEGSAALRIPLKKDSIRLDVEGFIRNERPSFYFRHYHSRNAWWDNDDLNKVLRTRITGTLSYKHTRLSATLENVQNHLYFQESLIPVESSSSDYTTYRYGVTVAQASKNIQLLSITLGQDFVLGPLHWDNELTYQTSTNKDLYPVPTFTCYTNLYLLFRIAKVLRTELGADMRFFTKYYAPAYSPIIGQYAVQDKTYGTEIGNYPIINAYVNFHLKRTRFYVMASHVNYSSGSGCPFLVPHYPLNRMLIRFGVSWNFIN